MDTNKTTEGSSSKRKRRRSSSHSGGKSSSSNTTTTKACRLLNKLSISCNAHKAFHTQHDNEEEIHGGGGGGGNPDSDVHAYTSQEEGDASSSLSRKKGRRDNHSEGGESGGSIPPKCQTDISALKMILPRVEQEYVVTTCSNKNEKQKSYHAQDMKNLCSFYMITLSGGLCPHSKHILYDDCKLGIEILPRIHLLFSHFSSHIIIDDTIKSHHNTNKKRFPTTTTTTTTTTTSSNPDKKETPSQHPPNPLPKQEHDHYVSEEMCFTAATFLNTIPEPYMKRFIIRDLFALLYDISLLLSSGVLHVSEETSSGGDGDAATNNITTAGTTTGTATTGGETKQSRVQLIFLSETCEILNQKSNNTKHYEYLLHISTTEQLLSLQTNTFHTLFFLLTFQYDQKQLSTFSSPLECKGRSLIHSDPTLLADIFVLDDSFDLQETFIVSLRTILLDTITTMTTTNTTTTTTTTTSTACNLMTHVVDYNLGNPSPILLILRNKLMACNLLKLLLPDLSSCAHGNSTRGKRTWTNLAHLLSMAIQVHLHFLNGTKKLIAGMTVGRVTDATIQDLMDCISRLLIGLFRDVVLSPLVDDELAVATSSEAASASVSLSGIQWRIQTHTLSTLMDCIPIIYSNVELSESKETSQLCRLILRGIHLTLSCSSSSSLSSNGREHFFGTSNNNDTTTVDNNMIQIVHHCIMGGIFPNLFNLLTNVEYCTLSREIILLLMEYEAKSRTGQVNAHAMMEHVCKQVWDSRDPNVDGQDSNEYNPKEKKQRLSPMPGSTLKEVDMSSDDFNGPYNSYTFIIIPSMIGYIHQAFIDAKNINAIKESEMQSMLNGQTEPDPGVLQIANSLCFLESLHYCSRNKNTEKTSGASYANLVGDVLYQAAIRLAKNCIRSKINSGVLDVLLRLSYHTMLHSRDKTLTPTYNAITTNGKQFLLSMSNSCMKYISKGTQISHVYNDDEINSEVELSTEFSLYCVRILPRRQTEKLASLFQRKYGDYQKLYKKLQIRFGLTRCDNDDCFYPMFSRSNITQTREGQTQSYNSDARSMIVSDTFFVEQYLPLLQRCILLVSIFPIAEEDLSPDLKYVPIMSAMSKILHPRSTTHPSILIPCLFCYPLLQLSLGLKRIEGGPGRDKVSSFASYLKESIENLPIFDVLRMDLTKDQQTQDDYYRRLLRRISHEVLSHLVNIYTICIDKSQEGDNMTDRSILFRIQRSNTMISPISSLLQNYNFITNGSHDQDYSFKDINTNFGKVIFDVLKSIEYAGESELDFDDRKARWDLVSSCCRILPVDDLRRLSPFLKSRNQRTRNNSAATMNNQPTVSPLAWLFHVPFVDKDKEFRSFAARKFGTSLFSCDFKVALSLPPEEMSLESSIIFVFQRIDDMLQTYCGVSQTQSTYDPSGSIDMELSHSAGTYSSNSPGISSQVSAVTLISSLCHSVDNNTEIGLLIIEKGILRLVRIWIESLIKRSDLFLSPDWRLTQNVKLFNHHDILTREEIRRLADKDIFGAKLLEYREQSLLPSIFTEILSEKSNIQISDLEHYGNSYELLICFIQSFLLKHSTQSEGLSLHSRYDRMVETFDYVEKRLPAIMSTLIIEGDAETLWACTGFRTYLGSEINKLRDMMENIMTSKMMSKTAIDTKRLKKDTLNLLLSDNDECLKFRSTVLSHLFLCGEPRAFRFLNTAVLDGKTNLKTLMLPKSVNGKVAEEIFWKLVIVTDDSYIHSLQFNNSLQIDWKDESLVVYKALISAAHRTIRISKGEEDSSGSQPLNSQQSPQQNGIDKRGRLLAQDFVRANSLRLLIKFLTKWKRGSLQTKIVAMKSFLLLMYFMDPDDTSQYQTQVLNLIELSMNFTSNDNPSMLSKLRLLAVRTLVHFVHILLSKDCKLVGENLCKIVVSFLSLLDNSRINQESDENDSKAIVESTSMLEELVEGDHGRILIPYFNNIPFLPHHPRLNHLRELLRNKGVNLDYLQLSTSQLTEGSNHCSYSSREDSSRDIHHVSNVKMQTALRNRLQTLIHLLSNENENVRRAVLTHLIHLIKGNRKLFHSLVNDEGTSMGGYLTVKLKADVDSNLLSKDTFDEEGGSKVVASLISGIMSRCIRETNTEISLMLAVCMGEIGAIDPRYIAKDASQNTPKDISQSSPKYTTNKDSVRLGDDWMFTSGAPWKFQSIIDKTLLHLVANKLVVALKASHTPTDQHKMAFAIQEALRLLHSRRLEASTANAKYDPDDTQTIQEETHQWLKNELKERGVLDTVEPFWSSNYIQREALRLKEPPFFRISETYYSWISTWTRYLIERSKQHGRSSYRDLFFCFRSSIRSEDGIDVIESLLPLLVLDSVCFGDNSDRRTTISEMKDVITIGQKSKMEKAELQKAISAVFMIIETLHSWAQNEMERKNTSGKGQRSSRKLNRVVGVSHEHDSSEWSVDESICQIKNLLDQIPLSLCAQAACNVEMFSQALRYLEMQGRKNDAEEIYGEGGLDKKQTSQSTSSKRVLGTTHIKDIDVCLLHRLFGELNDPNSMTAVGAVLGKQHVIEHIREKQVYGDWNGVLKECEQAAQNRFTDDGEQSQSNKTEQIKMMLVKSQLKAYLEMGQLTTTLRQINGVVMENYLSTQVASIGNRIDDNIKSALAPYAVEATWRLSRWDLLDDLLYNSDVSSQNKVTPSYEGDYNIALGTAMLGLQRRDKDLVSSALNEARKSIMSSLSVAALADYSRAYPDVLKLHCLTEIEDASGILCDEDWAPNDNTKSNSLSFIAELSDWEGRLQRSDQDIAASIHILNVRLSLARISCDRFYETSLLLRQGKHSRKNGLLNIANSSLSHAESVCQQLQADSNESCWQVDSLISEVHLQLSKIKYSVGQSTEALQMVEDELIQDLMNKTDIDATNSIKNMQVGELKIRARKALQNTKWMIEGGLNSGSEIMSRYHFLQKHLPKWERAHYMCASHIDSILSSRINAQADQMETKDRKGNDTSLREKVIKYDEGCQKYVFEAMKEYGESLKLNLKHLYEALPRLLTLWFELTGIENGSSTLQEIQIEANEMMEKLADEILPIGYYAVLPQLISRVCHGNQDTASTVCDILQRVLVEFPEQAVWSLGWLINSKDKKRKKKGEKIFSNAQANLKERKNRKMHRLLQSSASLFTYLINNVAKLEPRPGDNNKMKLPEWKDHKELINFLPPVQSALKISNSVLASKDRKETKNIKAFPSSVPRMRAFNSSCALMASKAKPKRITAFAVPEEIRGPGGNISTQRSRQNGDLGEIHFLVKQEAKGDLRKDARVQDLNNVINRLLTKSSGKEQSGRRQHHRLNLRTFSVICLSEDCGILEWVPNTSSFRRLVESSYHPYVHEHCFKRRGSRLGCGSQSPRLEFQRCQELFYKHNDLTQATSKFNDFIQAYPPVFYWWFIQNFQDPHQWFEARTKFTLSAAVWSAVGHVIGLGDRHSENILIDVSNGECVHVDFDCIFDKGLYLSFPEVVPFRLTPNFLDAFGPTGAKGSFSGGLTSAMSTLRSNSKTLLSMLEPFVNDPIVKWTHGKKKRLKSEYSKEKIEQRLKGVYNYRDGDKKHKDDQNTDEHDEMVRLVPLSLEGQVHKLITEATSHENLVQVFHGWMPWL